MFSTEITVWDYVQFASMAVMALAGGLLLLFKIEDLTGNYWFEDFIVWLRDMATSEGRKEWWSQVKTWFRGR